MPGLLPSDPWEGKQLHPQEESSPGHGGHGGHGAVNKLDASRLSSHVFYLNVFDALQQTPVKLGCDVLQCYLHVCSAIQCQIL